MITLYTVSWNRAVYGYKPAGLSINEAHRELNQQGYYAIIKDGDKHSPPFDTHTTDEYEDTLAVLQEHMRIADGGGNDNI